MSWDFQQTPLSRLWCQGPSANCCPTEGSCQESQTERRKAQEELRTQLSEVQSKLKEAAALSFRELVVAASGFGIWTLERLLKLLSAGLSCARRLLQDAGAGRR